MLIVLKTLLEYLNIFSQPTCFYLQGVPLNHMEETLNIQRKGTRPTSACAGVGAP